jgi:hypothetical protein
MRYTPQVVLKGHKGNRDHKGNKALKESRDPKEHKAFKGIRVQ